METAAPKGGGADGDRKTTGPCNSIPRAAAAQVATPDLPALRDRLLEARRRLVGRVALEHDPEQTYPEPGLLRVLADVQAAIVAVGGVLDEDGGAP